MKIRSLRKRILILKYLLNIFLCIFSPTNTIVVYLSQKLDKHVYMMQKHRYHKYILNNNKAIINQQAA